MSDFIEMYANKHHGIRAPYSFDKRISTRVFNKHDPVDQKMAINIFKDMIGASMDFVLKDKSLLLDEEFLKRFLYARKFRWEEAMQLLKNYLSFKEQHKSFLQKINIFDEHIQLALRDGNPSVLQQRDRRGRKVINFVAANWDPLKYSLEDVFRALLLTIDKLLENVQNQALGFVIIVDWTNFTYRQSSHLSPKILKLMIEALQDCMPLKFKGIHFIAQPWYVEMAMAVIKPFLKDKTKERLMTHGTNLTTLHELVCKDILPPDLGGEGPSINTLDWYHYLLESSQIPEKTKSYRLITPTVYDQAPVPKSQNGCAKINGKDDFATVIGNNESNNLPLIS